MDLESMKAAFLAKGGRVTIAAPGEGAGLTNADWREIVRQPGKVDVRREAAAIARDDSDYFEAERQAERRMEAAREGYHVAGRAGAMSALNRRNP